MKVQVSKLKPNPYRKISKYPFDKEKLKALRQSIKKTTFWDNILARPAKGGFYEIAYGHHRLKVIQSLGIKTVDIPVRPIDDATMLRIMASENMDEWKTSPSCVNETVLATKEFLDKVLVNCESQNDMTDRSISHLFNNAKSFSNAKRDGVGRATITRFLGGAWNEKGWVVQEALSTLHDNSIDREAVEMMPSIEQAKNFKQAVKSAGVSRAAQKVIAKKVIESGVGSRGTADIVDFCVAKKKKKTALAPKKPQKDIDEFVKETTGMAAAYEWKDSDPEYAKAFESATGQYIDLMEKEADRRAIEGVAEPILDRNGQHVLDKNGDPLYRYKYSDTLLIFRLKAMNPEKYAERRRVDQNVSYGGQIQHTHELSAAEQEKRHADCPELLVSTSASNWRYETTARTA